VSLVTGNECRHMRESEDVPPTHRMGKVEDRDQRPGGGSVVVSDAAGWFDRDTGGALADDKGLGKAAGLRAALQMTRKTSRLPLSALVGRRGNRRTKRAPWRWSTSRRRAHGNSAAGHR